MRITAALLTATMVLTGCGGGGGGGGTRTATPPPETPQEPNIATIHVGPGPYNVPNLPLVSVTVCVPGDAAQCHVIDDVLLDTGSVGLRLAGSVLRAKAPTLHLPAVTDLAGNGLYECVGFVDGSHAWGAVRRADVKIGGRTAANIPIQVVGDLPGSGGRPSNCTSLDPSQDLAEAANLGANGILGVRYFIEDCGPACINTSNVSDYDSWYYFACGSGGCVPAGVPLDRQVKNPVAAFPEDNNGVLVQLPAVAPAGRARVTGSLIFGIGTRGNNALTARMFDAPSLRTFYKNTTYGDAFIDSGSNGLYFDDPGIPLCHNSAFYCPGDTLNLTATIADASSRSQQISFVVTDLDALSNGSFALPGLAGFFSHVSAEPSPGSGEVFDWGLPFFFGRTVYVGMEGTALERQIGF